MVRRQRTDRRERKRDRRIYIHDHQDGERDVHRFGVSDAVRVRGQIMTTHVIRVTHRSYDMTNFAHSDLITTDAFTGTLEECQQNLEMISAGYAQLADDETSVIVEL